MQRQDHRNIQSGRFLEHRLDLLAIFADNADVVSSRFIDPVFFNIQSTEFAEAVGRE